MRQIPVLKKRTHISSRNVQEITSGRTRFPGGLHGPKFPDISLPLKDALCNSASLGAQVFQPGLGESSHVEGVPIE
ncbi:hypothetical protein CEXT_795091 [Caerostris extrusa]|uniref:Uncharacterized protein n=1 Tax=Caerostris extrusa TaxID=172846 RepID=A0AAV4TVH1_CAEEX|nr:hypothetical protein CEXT_795091 [Caerostris extrusa]